ncbi:SH3 domain-containing protein [Sulfitobacter delicatus]|nr:SH3 domain-containing protein [Sulfitobacter delicatus]
MKRFIFLTFGFMGWAFYEMSGGADFEPASQRMARLQDAETTSVTEASTEAGKIVTAAAENAARDLKRAEQREKVFAASNKSKPREATRVALNLTTLSDLPRASDMAMVEQAVAKTPVPKATETRSISDTGAKVIKASAPMPQNAGYTVSSSNTPAIIPSLIAPNDTAVAKSESTTVTQISTTQADIRTVSGNRVNVRRGPGTNFGIVGKLGAGDAVKIIEDNGDGWVRLRSVDGKEMGWMAEFLLSSS